MLLVLALLLGPVVQVSAEELPEAPTALSEPEGSIETEPPETQPPVETEVPGETQAPEETEVPQETEPPETVEVPEETEAPVETTVPEETEEAALWLTASPVTIAEVLAMAAGREIVMTEGTVVFASGTQAVLQDATGGIRLSFASPPEIAVGDVLLAAGHRSSGFVVEEFEKTGTAELPAQKAALTEGRSDVRILVTGVVLGQNSLSQNGYICQMDGDIPLGIQVGQRVDAWGVMLDGVFYADTITLSEDQAPESSLHSDWNFYFGQLHAHTDISDGLGTVEEAFAYAKAADKLDFFAVTDHSNSFDNASSGTVAADGKSISQEWAAGKAAAEAVTDETFVGIFGYEMTWQEDLAIGHINTFATPGWQTREQEGMETLEGYLDALAAVPDSVSQFNHPGLVYGDFQRFSNYSPQHDSRVHLLEVGSEGSFRAYDAYTVALDAGWHLAPSMSENNHKGNWGSVSPARTVVLAQELTEAAIYDAVRNYRVYATEDADLQIEYHLNDRIMGSILAETAALTADIRLEDGSGDPIGRVEVITDGGKVAASVEVTEASAECSLEIPLGGSYYYLRILRDGVITAVTAPVWVDTYEDLGISDFTADAAKPAQGTESHLTLTLFNQEDLPFVVESVTFCAGVEVIEDVTAPGSVPSVGELQIPLTYTQENAGTVTITATVTGTIGGLSRSYQKDIRLQYQAAGAQLLSVKEVRGGNLGDAYRIRGYVTAGTSKSCNRFPGSIYLQDDSGGIEIMDFTERGVQLGTPMEVEGILRSAGGNLVLAMTNYEILDEDYYRYTPKTTVHKTAMNYETHGGELLQIEGSVVSLTKTADGKGVSRFTVRDLVGDLATVIVEDGIGSGAYGTNELASEVRTTRTVRAIGLLHIDEYGARVLRVRNCDEVVYVPPLPDRSNPKTGDWFAWLKYRS